MQLAGERASVSESAVLISGVYDVVKRMFDLFAALTLLFVLAPLLALCAVLVALDSPGPILFRQKRVGRGGKEFTFLKFRSMRADASAETHKAYAVEFVRGTAARQASKSDQVFKLVNDSRVTRVGRWLRRTSLDELPQLWNVVRGEMSLVGPRPPLPYEAEHYKPRHLRRLAVKPGITGLWQVQGRSRTTFEQMVDLDIQYVERRSLWFDIKILISTIPVVLWGRGAHVLLVGLCCMAALS